MPDPILFKRLKAHLLEPVSWSGYPAEYPSEQTYDVLVNMSHIRAVQPVEIYCPPQRINGRVPGPDDCGVKDHYLGVYTNQHSYFLDGTLDDFLAAPVVRMEAS